jgi:hypothetical protein
VIHLVAAAITGDIAKVRDASPDLWRQIRRYNLPVQLALAAAQEVAKEAENPATAALFSLAPCQSGSPELYQWVHTAAAAGPGGYIGNLRVNPTHTLHAVDNLALSAFAIMHRNHACCLGLGGAAGQAWCGLEALQERLLAGTETEAILMAGDQEVGESTTGAGIALLFSRTPTPCRSLGRLVKLVSVQRVRRDKTISVQPHATAGLAALVSTIRNMGISNFSYAVPPEQTSGMDHVTIVMEVS